MKWLENSVNYTNEENISFINELISKKLKEMKTENDKYEVVYLLEVVKELNKAENKEKKSNVSTKEAIERIDDIGIYDKIVDDILHRDDTREKKLNDFDLSKEILLSKFRFRKLSWEDTGDEQRYINLYNMYYDDTKIGSFKAIPENISIDKLDDIVFTIGWKPEYYKTIDALIKDEDIKTRFYAQFKDVSSMNRDTYSEIYKKHQKTFDESIFRFSSTLDRIKDLFKEEEENACIIIGDNKINFTADMSFVQNRVKAFIGANGTGKTKMLHKIYDERRTSAVETKLKSSLKNDIYFSFGMYDDINSLGDGKNGVFNLASYQTFQDYYQLISDFKILLLNEKTIIIARLMETLEQTEVITDFLHSFDAIFTENITIYESYSYFRKLSTGQKLTVLFVILLTINITPNTLVYIDELEVSLHPNLLNELLKTIDKILTENSSYALMATHSHVLIQSVPSSDVYIFLTENDEQKIVQPNIELYGKTFDEIILNIYGLEQTELNYYTKISSAKKRKCNLNEEALFSRDPYINYLLKED